MNTSNTITEDEFYERYEPLQGESGHYRFETYWAEPELSFLRKMDPHHLWTQVEVGDAIELLPGFHSINATSMVMSMIPWTDTDRDAGLMVVCEDPYDEKTFEGGENDKGDDET